MKKLVSILVVLLFTALAHSQNTFWLVKGGTGDEVGNYRSAHLDTTAGGNLIWLYNSTSTTTGSQDIVMEIWPKGGNSPQTELFLGCPSFVRLNNLQMYQDELYLNTALVNPAVVANSRAGLVRIDTNGTYISSFMYNGSQMGSYGNAYKCVFLQDTAYFVGQARSSAGAGNREDFFWAKLDINTNTSLEARRWNGFGTERIRDAISNNAGDSIFAAAYSYSTGGNTKPVFFHFDRQGNIIQQYYYTPNNSSFFQIEPTAMDSLALFGSKGSYHAMRVIMSKNGQAGSSLQYGSSNSGVAIRLNGAKVYGNQTLLFGYIHGEAMGNGGDEGFLMSIDAQGNVLWAKMYGGSGNESITDLQVTTDGFYLTGKTNSSSQGGWDAMLLKTDFNGDIGQLNPCFSITPYTTFVNASAITVSRFNFGAANSGALSAYSGPNMSATPISNIFDDNCNVLGVQIESKLDETMIEQAEFSVFPNPFGQRLSIELAEPTDHLELSLIDQMGELVQQQSEELGGESSYDWSLPDLAAGVYVLRIQTFHEGRMQVYQKALLHH